MPNRTRLRTDAPWEFDAGRLARTITGSRTALGWSTRDLARRADLSQPYVVALERARDGDTSRSPVPSVEVIARLAHALGFDPLELARLALRPAGRHVLLVVEDTAHCPLHHAVAAVACEPDRWIWAASGAGPHNAETADHLSIDLRRDGPTAYEPDRIAASLVTELQAHRPDVNGRHLGLVFADTSKVMMSLTDPQVVVDFEHRWHHEVTSAALSVGAHAAWNVCVYESGALSALPTPLDATVDLLRSHDTVWSAQRDTVITGAAAARRILSRLRPAGTHAAAWRAATDQIVASLELAA